MVGGLKGLKLAVTGAEARARRPLPEGYIATERISMLPLFRGASGAIGSQIFRYLCERALFKESACEVYGANVHLLLRAGQLWTRTRQIEKDLGISKSTVAEWLKRLAEAGLIRTEYHAATKVGSGFQIVTVTAHLLAPGSAPVGAVPPAAPRPPAAAGAPPSSAKTPPPSSVPADEKNPDPLKNSSSPGQGEDGDGGSAKGSDPADWPPREAGESRFDYAVRLHRWEQEKITERASASSANGSATRAGLRVIAGGGGRAKC